MTDDGTPPVGDDAPRPARGPASLTRYLPLVSLVTAFVVVVPIAVVWALRADGWASSLWVVVPLAIVLSLATSFVARALWQRRRRAGDLMFSELLLWGW